MHLTIVRHGRAEDKRAWTGDDLLRPLDATGTRQAEALAPLLAEHRVRRVISSPALRCQQSVRPLVDLLGLPLELWDELGPDARGGAIVTDCFGNPDYDDAVLCTHGEVMQPLTRLEDLRRVVARRHLRPDRLLKKGSAWRMRLTAGSVTKLVHLVPPG